MPRILYTSWISPFARKVALGLELKGLAYEAIDALQSQFGPELRRVNPRGEVPVLLDDETVIVNSSDILQYLDWQYPQPALYPDDKNFRSRIVMGRRRVRSNAWRIIASTRLSSTVRFGTGLRATISHPRACARQARAISTSP